MDIIVSGGVRLERSDTSPTHTRILVAVIVITCLVMSETIMALGVFFALAVFMWRQSPLGFQAGLKRLLLIDSLIFLTILPLPFSFVGEQVITAGPLVLSEVGLVKAIEVFIKSTLSAIIMITQLSGVTEIQLANALQRLRVPSRFILLLQFTVRYISVMHRELSKMRLALRARGLGGGPSWHNWKCFGYLFGMLFVKALARADQIWFAMKCRGYRGHFPKPKVSSNEVLFDQTSFIILSISSIFLLADSCHLLAGYRL
ncbi:energy-coupling factor transporter transmembrane component T family protein [Vibrio maritimus]|uniref:energy-coupling factor transporter transmembrane component T family protein n=1 Tax=Vibrio maritimus TaxID=990268 RepID=UPI0037363B96